MYSSNVMLNESGGSPTGDGKKTVQSELNQPNQQQQQRTNNSKRLKKQSSESVATNVFTPPSMMMNASPFGGGAYKVGGHQPMASSSFALPSVAAVVAAATSYANYNQLNSYLTNYLLALTNRNLVNNSSPSVPTSSSTPSTSTSTSDSFANYYQKYFNVDKVLRLNFLKKTPIITIYILKFCS